MEILITLSVVVSVVVVSVKILGLHNTNGASNSINR